MSEVEKARIRRRVWRELEESGEAAPPFPVEGRIPNFRGAQLAARRLTSTDEYEDADVIKVNPDSPQRPVRERALRDGKTLIMPTPRLRQGFLVIENPRDPRRASTIRGAFREGRRVMPDELPAPDLVVAGSVAVAPDGARLGKGGGYFDLEWGILAELGLVDEDTPVHTTVHDVQVLPAGEIPMEEHDVPVDVVHTPTGTHECDRKYEKPEGLLRDRIGEKLDEVKWLRDYLD
ncbi:MAG: 5-formyltetrahydrofolate cyclo-ligase [Euryarchaeota archaeon]